MVSVVKSAQQDLLTTLSSHLSPCTFPFLPFFLRLEFIYHLRILSLFFFYLRLVNNNISVLLKNTFFFLQNVDSVSLLQGSVNSLNAASAFPFRGGVYGSRG